MSGNYYCPKCGKKKLVKSRRWDYENQAYYVQWRCEHNKPGRTWRAKKPDGPQCDVEIKTPGRDAEIEDWGDALSKMATICVPQIQQWLLKNDSDVRKRGLEVVYEGPIASLVRRRDAEGVGVGLYWNRATWDEDEDVINPMTGGYDALRHEAAGYLDFEGFNLSYLFGANGVDLWSADEDHDTAVFKAKSVGKRLKAKLCALAERLEKAIPDLLVKATAERSRWISEKKHFERTITTPGPGTDITVQHYNGETKTAWIRVPSLSPLQMSKVNEALGLEMKMSAQLGRYSQSVSPEQVIRFSEVLGIDVGAQDVSEYFNGRWNQEARRVTLDEAVALREIVKQ